MFNTILTSKKPCGETIQRVYQGKTEKLSVYFATNLWSKYDKVMGEELMTLETTEKDVDCRSLYMIDNRGSWPLHPNDELTHS